MGLKNIFWVFVLFLLIILPSKAYEEDLVLSITRPRNGERVCWRSLIEGRVSDPQLQVFVAIHPMATNRFWIQPVPNVASDGSYSVYGYFGEPNQGIGEPFEIIAIATRNKELFKEGDTLPSPLPDNPEILVRSNPIIVIRADCLYE